MNDVVRQIVERGGMVYFPECFANIIVGSAFIRDVDEKAGTFNVRVYHDDDRDFYFSEYGKWIFSTEEEAKKAIKRIPKKGQTVYQIIDKQIVKKQVESYKGYYNYYTINLHIVLTDGEEVHLSELDKTLFTNLKNAKKQLK